MDASSHGVFNVSSTSGVRHEMNDSSRAYISVFDIMELSRLPNDNVSIWADECALWFCVQGINISFTNGQESQAVQGNYSKARLDYPSSAHGTEWVFDDIPRSLNAMGGSRYAVTQDAMTALRDFMNPLMRGTVSSDVSAIDYSSDWIEAMWNATYDLPTWISNLALSLTNEVRLAGHGGGDYDGHATQLAPVINVQWLWMIYPLTLISASVYYLLSTIVQSSRDGVSVWKSDALPMLFCRIDSTIHEKVKDGMDVPNGLEERVGPVEVALQRTDAGEWTFRTANDRAHG